MMKPATRIRRAVTSRLKRIGLSQASANPIDAATLPRLREAYLRAHWSICFELINEQPHLSHQEASAKAAKIDVYEPYYGRVPYFELPRKGKRPRVVFSLPQRLRIAQKMARRLIEAQFTPGPHIYNWKGRGGHRLIVDLVSALKQDGARLIIADVQDCYDSVNFDAVYDLDILPKSFVQASMDVRRMNVWKAACVHDASISKAKRELGSCSLCRQSKPRPCPEFEPGLVQGSAASDALLAMLFNDFPGRLPKDVTPFVISDNIALVCTSNEAARSAREALVSYFSNHPAGALSLTFPFEGDPRLGFEFLGYRIEFEEGAWIVDLSDDNHWRVLGRLERATGDDAGTFERMGKAVAGFPSLSASARARLWEIASCGV